jgi:hypothetical protein
MNTETKKPAYEILLKVICPIYIRNEALERNVSKEIIIFEKLEQMKYQLNTAHATNPKNYEIKTTYKLSKALEAYVLNAMLVYSNDEKQNENTIDPDEIDYMEADEYGEGYYYNRLTGKIIKQN